VVLEEVLLVLVEFAFGFLLSFKVLAKAVFSLLKGDKSLAFHKVKSIIPFGHFSITQNKVFHLGSLTKSIASCLSLASFIKSIQVFSLTNNANCLASALVVVPFASLFIASSHLFNASSQDDALNILTNSFLILISFAISSSIFA
jgi:hypothetical protein